MCKSSNYQKELALYEWLMSSYQVLCEKQCKGVMLNDDEIEQMKILFVTSFNTAGNLIANQSFETNEYQEHWRMMEDVQTELLHGSKFKGQSSIILLVLVRCYNQLRQIEKSFTNHQ